MPAAELTPSHRRRMLASAVGLLVLAMTVTLAPAHPSAAGTGSPYAPSAPTEPAVALAALTMLPVGDSPGSVTPSPVAPPVARAGAQRPARMLPLIVPSGRGRTIYLTFDDGPDPTWTPRIVALLRHYHVPATFFAVGYNVDDHPALVRLEHAAGFAVENHTQDHVNLVRYPAATMLSAQVLPASRAIRAQTGTYPTCVRPPYGAFDARVRSALGAQGLRLALWSVDTRDWARPGALAVERAVLAGARPGAVVLLHDGGGDRSQTVAALAYLLPRLLAAHWSFGEVCR